MQGADLLGHRAVLRFTAACGGRLCQLQHLGLLVVGGGHKGAGVVQRDVHIGQLVHLAVQMLGQVAVVHGAFAVRAVHQRQQQGVLELDALKGLEGLQADAVGGVGAAVLVHQLLGVVVGHLGLFGGQLPAQLGKAGVDGGKGAQGLQRLVGHIVLDHGGLAAVGIGGDSGLQKGLDVSGVLVLVGQLGSLLVGAELGQQIQAGGHFKVADLAHGVRGGQAAACQTEDHDECAYQRKQFLFHV